MKTSKFNWGYKLEYKGYVRFVSLVWGMGWSMFDDEGFSKGQSDPTETLREQKNSLIYLIDNGYDLGQKIIN